MGGCEISVILLIFVLISVSILLICSYKKCKIFKNKSQKSIFIRQNRAYKIRAKELIKCLEPKDAVNRELIRAGRDYDGGYVMVNDFNNCSNDFNNCSIAYSFGISNDVSWDLDIANCGMDVYMYDHTIEELPMSNSKFHFFKTGICGTNERAQDLKTLEEILSENGHLGEKNLILKIDVEGAEWDVFLTTPSEVLSNFRQILVEFHQINTVWDEVKYPKIKTVLEKLNLTHQIVHVHANNYGEFDIIGGIPFPNTFEITYLIKEGNSFEKSQKDYPVPGLDQACNPYAPDFYLNFFYGLR